MAMVRNTAMAKAMDTDTGTDMGTKQNKKGQKNNKLTDFADYTEQPIGGVICTLK